MIGVIIKCNLNKWGGRRGLNPRPPESQSGALPTELRPPFQSKSRYGAPGRIRTCDPLLRRQMLYPAELPGDGDYSIEKELISLLA